MDYRFSSVNTRNKNCSVNNDEFVFGRSTSRTKASDKTNHLTTFTANRYEPLHNLEVRNLDPGTNVLEKNRLGI